MPPDLDKLEAVLSDPLIDWKAGFGHGLFSDGWSYNAAVIIAEALNAVPGLISECKRLRAENSQILTLAAAGMHMSQENQMRLREQLAAAKAEGAAEELETLFHRSIFIVREDGTGDRAVTLDAINARAAELRKAAR